MMEPLIYQALKTYKKRLDKLIEQAKESGKTLNEYFKEVGEICK